MYIPYNSEDDCQSQSNEDAQSASDGSYTDGSCGYDYYDYDDPYSRLDELLEKMGHDNDQLGLNEKGALSKKCTDILKLFFIRTTRDTKRWEVQERFSKLYEKFPREAFLVAVAFANLRRYC